MPQKYKRKEGARPREQIPPDILKAAVDKALSGQPLHSVANEYGLSRNTIRRYVREVQRGSSTLFSSNNSNSQIFSTEDEEEIAAYLGSMARMNNGLTTQIMDKLAHDLASRNQKKIPDSWEREKKAGYFWRRGFLERHSHRSLKKPEATSLSRSTSFNKHNVNCFFDNLAQF